MRVIHAVRELNEERDDDPITVIALYTEPERRAMFVRHADEAYCLGPTATVDADGKRTGAYLDYEGLERALRATAGRRRLARLGLRRRAPRVRRPVRAASASSSSARPATSCASSATRSSPS